VDISSHIEKKIDAIVECVSQGGGNDGSLLRARLAKAGKRLPLLGNDDRTADREYTRRFHPQVKENRNYGQEYSIAYAERFYHIGQQTSPRSEVEDYIDKNAVAL
jgi:hypothetical protein